MLSPNVTDQVQHITPTGHELPSPLPLYARQKDRYKAKPRVGTLDDARRRIRTTPMFLMSARLFITEEFAETNDPEAWYRYVPIFDFDDRSAPDVAFKQAVLFAEELKRQYGLLAGKDFDLCPSGQKGAKIFFRLATPVGQYWARAFQSYYSHPAFNQRYPALDLQMFTTDVARWVGARHPKTGAFQNPILPVRSQHWTSVAADRLDAETLTGFVPDPDKQLPHDGFARLCLDVRDCFRFTQLVDRLPRASARMRGRDWRAILEAAGIHVTAIRDARGEASSYVRLGKCPCCGRRQKAIVYLNSGRLLCYSPNCAAWDRTKGLPPGEWAKHAGIRLSGPDPQVLSPKFKRRATTTQLLSLDAGREQLDQEVQSALENRGEEAIPRIIAATPGVGKTTATLKRVAERAERGERFAIAAPTRELAIQIANTLQEITRVTFRVLSPRSPQNCKFFDEIQAIARLGWPPGRMFCPNCLFETSCEYYREQKRARDAQIVVGPWESVLPLTGAGRLGHRDSLIVDEFPLRALVEDQVVSASDLSRWVGSPELSAISAAATLLNRVIERAAELYRPQRNRGPERVSGKGLRDVVLMVGEGSGCDPVELLESAMAEAAQGVEPAVGSLAGMAMNALTRYRSRHVVTLIKQLRVLLQSGEHPKAVGVCLCLPSAGHAPYFRFVRIDPPRRLPDLVLDAFADGVVYSNLFRTPVEVRNVSVEQLGRYWLLLSPTSKRGFDRHRMRLLADFVKCVGQVRRILGQRATILVLTHKALVDDLEALQLPNLAYRHFFAGHGTNRYEDCAATIAFGTPRINPFDLYLYTAALFEGEDEPNQAFSFPFYEGVRMARVETVFREAEIAQSVHRVRPAISKREVVLMTDSDCGLLPKPHAFSVQGFERFISVGEFFQNQGFWSPEVAKHLWGPDVLPGRNRRRVEQRDYKAIEDELTFNFGSPHSSREGGRTVRCWGSIESYRKWRQSAGSPQLSDVTNESANPIRNDSIRGAENATELAG